MGQVVKKEKITIVIGTYKDQQGQDKKKSRTIGELVTMRGDDGSEYQFGEMWGPTGSTKFNVYPQDDNRQQAPQQGYQQQPQQGYQQQPQHAQVPPVAAPQQPPQQYNQYQQK